MSENSLMLRSSHLMPAMSLSQASTRFAELVRFTHDIMRENVDYGIIAGTEKPTLLKPGAEKLTTFFGLTTRFELVEKVEDWTGDEHGAEPFFYYWFRCRLFRGDLLIAEADGSCNSWESKYRYRLAKRTCPVCGEATINRSKYPPRDDPDGEPGWYCFPRAGGCGSNFPHDAPAITDQEVGRTTNPNPADVVNTIKKMSQKRALVAATLLAVNASEFFTQDLEDLDASVIEGQATVIAPAPAPGRTANGYQRPLDPPTVQTVIRKKAGWQDGHRITEGEPPTADDLEQLRLLTGKAVVQDGWDHEEVDGNVELMIEYLVSVSSLELLTQREASALIAWLASDLDPGTLNGYARTEAAAILRQIAQESGQLPMELD